MRPAPDPPANPSMPSSSPPVRLTTLATGASSTTGHKPTFGYPDTGAGAARAGRTGATVASPQAWWEWLYDEGGDFQWAPTRGLSERTAFLRAQELAIYVGRPESSAARRCGRIGCGRS